MAKKDYDASVWASVGRSRRNAKAILDANYWDYFVTLTFPPTIRGDYYKVQKIALKWKKDLQDMGGKVFLTIGIGENGGYHIHAVLKDVPKEEFIPGGIYRRMIKVKTGGNLLLLRNAVNYQIGLHVVQEIVSEDDINRIADYIVGHFLEMRDLLHNAIMANAWPDITIHLYYVTRGLKRGTRIRWYLKGSVVRMYDNRDHKPALIVPVKLERYITSIIRPYLIEHYSAFIYRSRIVAYCIQDLIGALTAWGAVLIT